MTQLVRLAPMHVNIRHSFPGGSSHTVSGKKGGMEQAAIPDSPMGTLWPPGSESAQKQVPGPQSSPGVAGEMLKSESVQCSKLKGGSSKFKTFL